MVRDSSVHETPHTDSHSTRRARGRAWAVRGGIATAVLSVALVAPGVNEYAARQLASLAQPQLAREWYSQTHIPLSDVPPEQGFSRWVLPPALAERTLWRWDDATIQWLDQQAGRLPQALKSLQKINTVFLLPAMTLRREIQEGDQLYWTLVGSGGAAPQECGVTYSVGRGTEIALNRGCIEKHSEESFAKVVHELVHAWDLEQGEKLANPLWDEKRGMWSRRSLSTWAEDPLSSWASLSWKMRSSELDWVRRKDHQAESFVSKRAELSPLEDLAETAEQYFLNPTRVTNIAPRKAAWLKLRLFQTQAVSNSQSWQKK